MDTETIKKEITVKELLGKITSSSKETFVHWKYIIGFAAICAFLGFFVSIVKKPAYSATCSFVLDESNRSGSLGQYASLASLAGISLGGSGSLFEGDNIIELYKSRQMIKRTLLCVDTFKGKQQSLINRYIEFNDLRKQWVKDPNLKNISFDSNHLNFSRSQDSIFTGLIDYFNKKPLQILKPDKKLSIIKVQFESNDELFAKSFVRTLVNNVNDFYVKTKTKKSAQNVALLKFQVDSVRQALNSSISGVASSVDATPNANPLLSSLRVPSQRRQIDVQASTAIYSELVKNLELAKMSFRQDTPLIQIIDEPVLPLAVSKISKLKGIIVGLFLGIVLSGAYFFLKAFFK